MAKPNVNFSQRFLALIFAGYLIAVGAAALAVWWATQPVLKDWQDKAIREQAEAKAEAIRIVLQEIGLKTQLLARNNTIIKVVTGDEENIARASDQLVGFSTVDGMVSASVYDFSGSLVVSHQEYELGDARFSALDSRRMVSALLKDDDIDFRFDYRPGTDDQTHHFLVAQPIIENNFIEGVMVIEFAADMSNILSSENSVGDARLATPFQIELLDEAARIITISTQVLGAPIYIVLHPDRALAAKAGEDLVDTVLFAVGIFLLVPFCLTAVAGLHGIVAPHRALEVSQQALRQNQEKLSELADIAQRSNDAIISTDLDGKITWVNLAFEKSTGFSLREVLQKTPGEVLQGPETDGAETARISDALRQRKPVRSELKNYKRDGELFWNSLSISPQIDSEGVPYGFVAISSDVTEQRAAQDQVLQAKIQIEHQANHDALTGLPNRRALDVELERLDAANETRVLVRIDLDHFKNVNDTMGHAAGDHVLIFVSELLKTRIEHGDIPARVGGDEFVLLMNPNSDVSGAVSLAESLLTEIQKEILFEGKSCRIGASFGIATTGETIVENSELLLAADAALYSAKDSGRNRVVTYTQTLHESVVANRILAKEIEKGIIRREFEPYFQPQFDTTTFEVTGIEALVRWRHPKHGILAPAEFLPVAEQLSVASELDAMVMEKGLEAVAKLNAKGYIVPKVSFNVDSKRLEEPDLPGIVHQLAFDGTKVSFEILESVLIEEQSDLFKANVDLLREIGLGIEVDDFGSGHASIVGLTKLAPDTMKIDRELVIPLVESVAAQKMVRAVVEIGRALDISITAEGVETAAHAQLLCRAGCDTLQGFYFARPMSFDHLSEFLAAHRPSKVRQDIDAANIELMSNFARG